MAENAADDAIGTRILAWLRTPADLLVLGMCWTVASIPLITICWSTAALFDALQDREVDDSSPMLAAYVRGLRTTARVAARLSLLVLPALVVQIALAAMLLATRTGASVVALGFLVVVSAAWWSYLLTVHAAICSLPTARRSLQVRKSLGLWMRAPGTPILAVVAGATILAAAAQGPWVISVLAVSLPSWIVLKHLPRALDHPRGDHGQA